MATTTPDGAAAPRKRPQKTKPGKTRIDAYKMASDAILAALDRGTIPWKQPWAAGPGAIPRNLATGREYRGINVVLLALTGYASPYWLTRHQAKALGGEVRDDEKPTTGVFWKRTVKRLRTPEQEEKQREAGRLILHDEDGAYVILFLDRVFSVFNVTQFDGLTDIPEVQPIGEPTWSPEQRAQSIVDGYDGPTIAVGGNRACYSPALDRVEMPDAGLFPEGTSFYATEFHELAHSTGHEDRLNRADLNAPNSNQKAYAREELTAEMSAAMLCTVAGIDTAPLIERSAAYIDHWRTRISDDRRLVVIAAQRAQKACDFILGHQPHGEREAEAA